MPRDRHTPKLPNLSGACFLFQSPSSSKTLPLQKMLNSTPVAAASPASNLEVASPRPNFMISAPSEPSKIQMHSPAFYDACTFGGILSYGLTHMGVTPLDLVKCNM